jgi:hypothetical protein
MTFELFALIWIPGAFALAAGSVLLIVWLMDRREQRRHPAE